MGTHLPCSGTKGGNAKKVLAVSDKCDYTEVDGNVYSM